jgi:cobalamin synthase
MPHRYTADGFRAYEGRQSESAAVTRQKLGRLAWLLDSSIPIPGTRFTIGLEALIGLIPFVGDLVGVALSSYILSAASRMGVPKSVLLRMASNVALEGVIGMVPLAGDVFDAAFKANQRNVRLLEAWLDEPRKTERSTRAFGAVLLLACVGFLALLGAGSYFLIRLIVDSL